MSSTVDEAVTPSWAPDEGAAAPAASAARAASCSVQNKWMGGGRKGVKGGGRWSRKGTPESVTRRTAFIK
jgi:hypothetical protein